MRSAGWANHAEGHDSTKASVLHPTHTERERLGGESFHHVRIGWAVRAVRVLFCNSNRTEMICRAGFSFH